MHRFSTRPCPWPLLGLLAVAPLLPPAQVDADGIQGLDATERTQLQRGEIVLRRVFRRLGERKLFGGASWQVVDRPLEEVWAALLDVEHYGKMLPQVHRARLVARDGKTRIVRIEHGNSWLHVRYHVRMTPRSERHEMLFQLDPNRPSDLRAAWGFIRLTPWDAGRTLVSFGAMADMGSGLISGALRPLVHEWMLKVPWTLKKYLERGAGRHRYLRSADNGGATAPRPRAM